MAFDPDKIRHTLSTIFRVQGKSLHADLLDEARAEVTYAHEDYGVSFYNYNLRIPTLRFAKLEDQLETIAKEVDAKFRKLGVEYEEGDILGFKFFPELVVGPGAIALPVATPADERRLWKPDHIRVFLSHVSKVKDDVGEVKKALLPFGIDSFVAHEDIEPQQLWQREIEIALSTMDVLCAFITTDLLTSRWCDQEAGFALGRAVPVIAVNYGAPPHGFLGKHQAIGGDNRDAAACAAKIANVIGQQEHLQTRLTEPLVNAVVKANSYIDARESMSRLMEFQKNISPDQVKRLLIAVRDNSQVGDATGVPEKILAIAKEKKIPIPAKKQADEFDDDIPF